MAAGVHYARLDAVVHRAHRGLVRHVHLLNDGERVHIGAKAHHGAGLPAAEHANHAMSAPDFGAHFESERLEVVGDEL